MTLQAGLAAWGRAAGRDFRLLIDTGTVLTTLTPPPTDAGAAVDPIPRIRNDNLELLDDLPDGGDPVPRAAFDDVPILHAPLAAVGIDGATTSFGAILAGDLLQRFSLVLDYAAPAISLLASESACSCQLANACNAVLPFTLGGGGRLSLREAGEVYTYPPTRVTLDACLEAKSDPFDPDPEKVVPCRAGDGRYSPGYEIDQPPGTNVRLLVATGFSSVILGASAWDRLRGEPGAARRLLDAADHSLLFAGSPIGVRAASARLGETGDAPAHDAMVLVGREGLLGACEELARSRRLRWASANEPPGSSRSPNCDRGDTDCPSGQDADGCLQCLPGGGACGDPNRCNDINQSAAAYLDLAQPMDVFIVDDAAPVLKDVNDDIRPELSDVEGIIGTEVLARLALRIDYPNRRVIAQCASASGCTTYPRLACPNKQNDCGPRGADSGRLCNPPKTMLADYGRTTVAPDGGVSSCAPAPQP